MLFPSHTPTYAFLYRFERQLLAFFYRIFNKPQMLTVMKKITTLILCLLCVPVLVSAQQHSKTANNPNEAFFIEVDENTIFTSFILNQEENYELSNPIALRTYFNQNHYFKFNMPTNKDVDILFKTKINSRIGIAAYTGNQENEFQLIKTQSFSESTGLFKIQNDLVSNGEMITLRLWFAEEQTDLSKTFDIAIRERDPIILPKNINVNSSAYTPTQLVQDILVTGCLEAFNVTYNGDPVSIGYFSGSIGSTNFDEGIILTSGSASLSEGPNDAGNTGYNSSGGSDPDLQALIPGYSINDATILEFDFIPASDSLQFDFIFGSDEYPEWVSSDYNDVFGFFLSGPGITGPYSNNSINIALIPGTSLPVTIDNINATTNSAYYVSDSYGGDIEYDGATIPITAKATVQACETYHIKMAIGDAGDNNYDSGVFLNAKSFISGSDFIINMFNPWYQTDDVYEGCQTYAVFSRTDTTDLSNDIDIALTTSGTAIMNTDYSNIPDTVTIPADQISDTLIIDSYIDGTTEGPEYFIFTYTNGCPCTPVVNNDTIWIYDEIDHQILISNNGPICEGDTATLSISYNPTLDTSLIDWTWLSSGSHQQTIQVTPNTTTTYFIDVDFPCNTYNLNTTVTVYENVDASIDPISDLCEDDSPITLTAADSGGTWSGNGVSGNTFDPAAAGLGDHIITYNVSNTNCSDSDQITIHVYEYLDPTIDPIDVQCRTDDAFLLTAATPGGTWTGPGVVGGQNFNPTNAGVGFHWIYYTLTNGACTSIDSIEIEVVYDVDATIHSVGTLCEIDTPIDLEANWHTGVWTGPGITDAAEGIFDPSISGPGNHEIEFQVGTGGTCSDDDTIIIHVDAMPDATISPIGPFCYPGNTVNLSAATSGGTWSGLAISDPVNGTFNPSLVGTGSTQVIYSVGSGSCYDSDTVNIIVNAAPSVNIGTDQTHCDYDVPVTLDAGAGFSYAWSTGSSTQTISPASTGNYSVIITDANGCTATDDMNLIANVAPTVDLGADQTHCDYDVPITLDAGAGFSYAWSNGATTQTIAPATTGNYSVVITDANGCTATDDMNLIVNVAPNVDLGADQTHCDYDVPITLDAGAGFSYAWSNGATTQTIAPATTGNYSVVITDANGCTATDDMNLIVNVAPNVDLGADQTHCDYDMPITLDAGAGFSYAWSNGATTQIIAPATSGNYSVVITDLNGCTATDDMNLTVNVAPNVDLGTDQTHCDYDVPVTLDAGAGFSYAWSTGESTQTIAPATSGNYSVIITDANGCTATDDMNLTVNIAPTVDLGADQTHCNYDVPITLDAGAGFSYAWSNGATTQIIAPATSGNYSVVITDLNGCTATDDMNLTVNVAPTVDLGTDQTHCDYDVPVTLDAGAGFSYNWNTGDASQTIAPSTTGNYSVVITDANGCTATDDMNLTVNVAPTVDLGTDQTHCDYDVPVTLDAGAGFSYAWSTGSSTQTISPASTGNYSVIITDANGCTATDDMNLIANVAPTVDLGADQTHCDYDVPITLDAGAGFSYAWSNGATTQTIAPATTGNYSVVITDANGCTATDDMNLIVNVAPNVDLGADQTHCDYDVPITLDAGAGFSYAWSNGATTQTIAPATTGNYSVVITDANGCTATDDMNLIVNVAPTVNLGADQTHCDYDVPVTLDTGAGFSYAWSNGETTQTISPATTGNYSVVITDLNGCTATDDMNLTVNIAPTVDLGADQTHCDYDMPITLDAGAGFSYAWSNGAATQTIAPATSGNYSVVITDANGCTATDDMNLTVNVAPTVDLGTDQTHCDYDVPVTLDAGAGFSYAWNTGAATQTIAPATSGNYSVVITDLNGCTATDDMNLTVNVAPNVDLGTDQTHCDYDVPVTLDAGAGFSYAWNTGATTQTISPATTGNYSVIITDANGCTATDDMNLTVNVAPNVDLGADQTHCDYDVPVTLDAGAGLSYAWSNGETTQTISPASTGNYSVIITDANGCTATDDMNLTVNVAPTVDLGTDQTHCDYDVPVTLDAGAGFSYAWSTGTSTQTISPATSGNYSVVITDLNGCTATDDMNLTVNVAPNVDLGADQTHCDYDVPVTLDAGAGLSYAWSNGETTQTISPASTGNYSVIITDANGCTATDDMNLTVNVAPTVDLGTDQTHCDYDVPVTLDAGAGFSYAWSTGTSTQTISPATSGNYSVVITDLNGCTATDDMNLTVNVAPNVDLGTDQTHCDYDVPVTLDAGAGFSYAWNTGATTQTISPATTGNYSVIITDANGCTATDDMNLTVNVAPNVDLGADQTHCDYDVPVTLDAGAGLSYAWSNGETTQTISPASTGNYSVIITDANGCTATDDMNLTVNVAPTVDLGTDQTHCDYDVPVTLDAGAGFSYAWSTGTSTQTISPATSGNYSVVITDLNGCTATDDMNLTVNVAPNVDLGADQTHCDYDVPVTLDAGAGLSYAWSNGETTQTISPASTGNYSVIITDANGCTATDDMNLTVNVAPTVDLGTDQTHCDYDVPVTLDAGAGFSYAWSTGTSTQTISPATSGNYSVVITDLNGCTATDDMNLTVNIAPTVDLGADQTHCDYDVPVTLNAGAGFSYAWSNGATTQTISPASTGNYSVIITDANGCTATDDMNLTVNIAPTVDLGADQTHCDYDVPITLDAGAGFSYNWNTGAATQTISPASTGNYSVIITDANGCTATDDMNLIVNVAPNVDLGADQTHCDYDIPITLDAGAGFSYAWSTGETTQIIAPATSGNYSVVITDLNGCTATDDMNLIVNIAPNVDLGTDQTHCDYDVPITLDAGAGFSYDWNTGAATQTITPASTGNYSVIITDANGCTATDDMNLIVNVAPNVDLGADQTHCDYDIPITLDAGAGFSYAWSTGETTQIIAPATSGNYSVVITDLNGCTATDDMNLTVNVAPTVDLGADQTHCDYDVPVTLDAGAGFSYAWNTGATTQTISPATTGNYSVIITDANGCTATDDMNLTVNVAPTVDLGTDQTHCDYDVPVTLDAGAGFTYAWNTGDASQTIAPSTTGNYSVIITDTNGCTATDDMNLTVNVAPTVNLGADQTHCDYDVPVTLDAGSGFSYAWNTGDASQTIAPSTTGNYSVIITDANGCTATDDMNLTVNVAPTVDLGTDQTHCDYDVPVTLDAGAGFSYNWNTGATTQTISPASTGNYSVIITDANGCTATDDMNLIVHTPSTIDLGSDIHLCESDAPITLTANPASLYEWNTGSSTQSIDVNTTGVYSVTITNFYGCSSSDEISVELDPLPNPGIMPTAIQCIDGEPITLSSTHSGGTWHGNGIINEAIGVFDPEVAGIGTSLIIYNFTVGMCSTSEQTNIEVVSLPGIIISEVNQPKCHGGSDGSITALSPSSDSPQFYWTGYGAGNTLANIPSDDYELIVEDINGCTNSTIVHLGEPDLLEGVITKSDVTCPGLSNGSATAIASGGTPPYKYYWSTGSMNPSIYNLEAGNYEVTIEDFNLCSTIKTTAINTPPPIVFNTDIDPVECGTSYGSIDVYVSGGHEDFTYTWDVPEWYGTHYTDLPSGSYQMTATDANGCTATTNIVVPSIGNINVEITEENSIQCFGYNTGALSASVVDGSGVYDYQWNTGSELQHISGLFAGNYVVSVNDNYGCSGTDSHYLNNPDEVKVAFSTKPVRCHGEHNGNAVAIASGGFSPYNYLWETTCTNDSLVNVCGGIYNITVTDNHNCTVSSHAYIHEPSSPVSANLLSRDITCYGFNDGRTIVEGYGGTAPYTYNWSIDGMSSSSQEISNLREGFYGLNITDDHGCSFDTIISITEPSPIIIDFISESPSCIGNDDGYIEFEVVGGNEPYTYYGDIATQNLPNFHGLYEGSYNFTITDGNGCSKKLEAITLYDNPEECIRIPDAFTPNGDGTNDTWIIENLEMFPNAIVQVFNRWGQEVYFGYHNSDPWDGTFEDKHLPTGSYVYIVDLHNQSKPKSGTITIVH